MARQPPTADMDKLDLEESEVDVEDLFASPTAKMASAATATTNASTASKQAPSSATTSAHKRSASRHNELEAREASLRAELERVREVNKVIENVTASLTKARGNMDTVNRTVSGASTLLATWTRILSQTEHNQRLILNPNWHGATWDLEDMENEEVRRQQEVERRAFEEQRRKEEAVRRAEEEERRKAAAAAAPAGRGHTRTRSVRGTSTSTRGGYVGVGGQPGRTRGTSGTRGTASGIARGTVARGRGRGVG